MSRLRSPPAARRRPDAGDTGETPRRARAARAVLDKRRRARRSCADLTAPEVDPVAGRMSAIKAAFLPLRPSKSLGRLDGLKEIERLAAYERLVGGRGDAEGGRRAAQRLSDLERVQDLFPHDYLALHNADPHANAKSKTVLRKRPSVDAVLGVVTTPAHPAHAMPAPPRSFLMEAPAQLCAAPPAAPAQPLDRHLFLFTDLLLIAKSRGNNCFKLKESIRISEIWISPGGGDTGFLLGWPSSTSLHNHLVVYPTQAARDTWFRKLQNVLNTQLSLEPKSTNIQILYKDPTCSVEFCKTLAVTPEMTTNMVIKQALQLIQNNNEETQGDQDSWGPAKYFTLWTKTSRDSVAVALNGIERPHAIQMSRIRQTLSNEEGFDLQHVNSKNNPCGMVFELRKKTPTNTKSVRGGLKMLRSGRSEGSRLFGISLERLCGADHRPPPTIMTLLRRLRMRAPHTEGVFRRSANAKALRVLRDKLDMLGGTCTRCPELETAPVLLLAALLKDFFRSLPQPLLLYSLYQNWINVLNLPPLEKVAAVRSLLLKLPKSHYNLLSYFICLLQAIAKNSTKNLMCPMNLGVCVGPSILWPSTPCEKAPKGVPSLIELLITNADALFGPQVSRLLGNLDTTNSVLDSGAEESDSVHSIGLSLDSLDLTCTRREKLSLSRDSGLMLSEDDSNSNGGNSPAPRNIQQLQISATSHTQDMQKVYMQNYKIEGHNINGLPNTPSKNYAQPHKPENYGHYNLSPKLQSHETNIYGNVGLQMSKCHYVTNNASVYSQRHRNNINNANSTQYKYNNDSQKAVCPDQTPAKYITGLEPEKPPRSNLSRAARTCKIYSMDTDVNVINTSCMPRFARAKSSDDLLDRRQSTKYTSNQNGENIYSNQIEVSKMDIKDYNIMKSESKESDCSSGLSYSRVYSGWDQRITKNYYNNNQTNAQCSDNSFAQLNKETSNLMHTTNKQMQTATIFTRNDWTRQASRTKSLEVNAYDSIYNQHYMDAGLGDNSVNDDYSIGHLLSNKCMKRSVDPAHVCTLKCSSVTNGCTLEKMYNINAESSYLPPLRNSRPETKENYESLRESGSPSAPERGHIAPRKLVHSKSLANIVLHTDSSSNDTLYQSQGNNYNCSMPNSSASSETSFGNKCSIEYPEPTYVSSTSEHSDTFCENIYGNTGAGDPIYSSDIYTAKLVQPEYHMKIYQQGPPPVPPRKGSQQNGLKKFPPVHVTNETKKSRSKSVPPVYRGPPEHHKQDNCKSEDKKEQSFTTQQTPYVLDLNCSDTDTESESYV